MSSKPPFRDPDTLSSNLGIRPADVRIAVEQERHNQDMARKKKKQSDLTEEIIQPTPEQLRLLSAMSTGPIPNEFIDQDTRTALGHLQAGGLAKAVEKKPHPALRSPQDEVLNWTLTERGSHVLKAALASPGDLEQLIAEADRFNPGTSIDRDGEYAQAIVVLYALLLRRFILQGDVSGLHIQAQFALDRFGW